MYEDYFVTVFLDFFHNIHKSEATFRHARVNARERAANRTNYEAKRTIAKSLDETHSLTLPPFCALAAMELEVVL
ncbi:hypothetical protein CEXT_652881 [Caerostris extrusa]|uniref:Uncharacterized protein n=1 Tax=Caerostris extrusa TaxID=172846 RepID=A0AAV4XQ29_CAEEX|nr:hypothetical protein CEXT_652881 [Caerostris extrusa]